jgi:hypothetical protein
LKTKLTITIGFICLCNLIKAQFNYQLKEINVPFSANNSLLPNALSGGLNYCNISRLDVNNDGKKDLIFFDKSDSKVHVYINNNTSTSLSYQYSSAYTARFPNMSLFCILADYNNDGKEDIFTSGSNGLIVYKNTSSATGLAFELATKKYGTIYTNYFPNAAPAYPETRLYNSGDAIPGIYDLDGDGDLEIFTFDISGSTVDVHQNKSKELYGNSDSLVFVRIDDCYGRFRETNCQNFSLFPASSQPANTVYRCDLTPFQLPQIVPSAIEQAKVQHAGASVLIFDPDKDGDADILLGDISCDSMKFFKNNPINGFNVMESSTINYPNANDPAKVFQYPAAYYLDINDDGKKDLLVSPNKTQAENKASIFYYKNEAVNTNDKDSFELVTKSFLQQGSIDLGEQAHPVLYDLDRDGDLDLLMGSGFFIDANNNNLRASAIYHFENTGTLSSANFELVTNDYLGIQSFGLKNLRPAFGDIDNDGDDDLGIQQAQILFHQFLF